MQNEVRQLLFLFNPFKLVLSVTVERWKRAASAFVDGNLPFSNMLDILFVAQVLLKSMVELVLLQVRFTMRQVNHIRAHLQAEYFLCYLLIFTLDLVQLLLTIVVM